MNSKPVSKEEFEAFLRDYPRPITGQTTRTYEPPLLSYNDHSEEKIWPESVVAWKRAICNPDQTETGEYEHFLVIAQEGKAS